jgi:hypothetical protein
MSKNVVNFFGIFVIFGKKMGPIEESGDFGGRKTRE